MSSTEEHDHPMEEASQIPDVSDEAFEEKPEWSSRLPRQEVKAIVEALLFVAEKPLSLRKIEAVLEDVKAPVIRELVNELRADFALQSRPVEIRDVGGGYKMSSLPRFARWIRKLQDPGSDRLSQAALETLAVVAYKQPIIRSEIEAIRGVDAGSTLHTLLEKRLIRIAGQKDAPGRPTVYRTTQEFLVRFGLKSLDELPNVGELKPAH